MAVTAVVCLKQLFRFLEFCLYHVQRVLNYFEKFGICRRVKIEHAVKMMQEKVYFIDDGDHGNLKVT